MNYDTHRIGNTRAGLGVEGRGMNRTDRLTESWPIRPLFPEARKGTRPLIEVEAEMRGKLEALEAAFKQSAHPAPPEPFGCERLFTLEELAAFAAEDGRADPPIAHSGWMEAGV